MQLRSRLFDKAGQLQPQWQGPLGFLRYVDIFKRAGNFKDLRKEILSMVDASMRLRLERTWPQISENLMLTSKLAGIRSLLTSILDENGELRAEYLTTNGLYRFVFNNKPEGYENLAVIYRMVFDVLTQQQQEQLGKFWLPFHGSPESFQRWQSALVDQDTKIHPQWLAPLGPYYFASSPLIPPHMPLQEVRANAMAVLSLENRQLIETSWPDFVGTLDELRTIYITLTDDDFLPREQFLGSEGTARALEVLKESMGSRGTEQVVRSAFSTEMGDRAFYWGTSREKMQAPSFQELAKLLFDPWGRLNFELRNSSNGKEQIARILGQNLQDDTTPIAPLLVNGIHALFDLVPPEVSETVNLHNCQYLVGLLLPQ